MANMEAGAVGRALDLALTGLRSCRSPGDGAVTIQQLEDLSKEIKLEYHKTSVLVTGLTFVVSAAIRSRAKAASVQAALEEHQFPAGASDLIVGKIRQTRTELQERFVQNRVRAPSLSSFRWRIDVTISTETLQKVFRPTILCEMVTSQGEVKNFEMPVESFHHLRYSVAKILRNMQEIERHPIMRLALEADREGEDDDDGGRESK